MLVSTKAVFLFAIVCLTFIQSAYASVYSQLQFIKIALPKNGQNLRAGKPLTVKYVMQPLVKGKEKSRIQQSRKRYMKT